MLKRKKTEQMAVTVCLCSFLFIMIGTGVIYSGYQLWDDHWILQTEIYLHKGFSVLDIIRMYIQKDLMIRVRPFYQVKLVWGTLLFGSNKSLWICFSMAEGILTSILLFYVGKNHGLNVIEAIFTVMVTLFGSQFEPWINALNAENTPTLLLVFGLYFISTIYQKENINEKSLWIRLLIMMSIILASGFKESFCLAIPAYFFYICYWDSQKNNIKTFGSILKRNIDYIVIFSFVFLIEIWFIINKIGLLSIGYAGIDKSLGLPGYMVSIFHMLSFPMTMRYLTGMSVIAFLFLFHDFVLKKIINLNIWYILFVFWGIFSQLVLYAKSGMVSGRYMLPFCIFWTIGILIPLIKASRNSKYMYVGVFVLLGMIMSQGYKTSWSIANNWKVYTDNTDYCLEKLKTEVMAKGDKSILIALEFPEWEESIRIWCERYFPQSTNQVNCMNNKGLEENYDVIITNPSVYENQEFRNQFGVNAEDYNEDSINSMFIFLQRK